MSSAATIPSISNDSGHQILPEAQVYLRRVMEKMKSLQVVEHVIANVERAMLNRIPEKFDFKPLINAINSLHLAIKEGSDSKIRVTNGIISFELETLFDHLAQRDEQIQPYNLRRFCDQSDKILDLSSFAALTSFYRALPRIDINRGKYDFVVTRLFTAPAPNFSSHHRLLKISREQLAKRLTEMCAAWGETIRLHPGDAAKTVEINRQFDNFIIEARQLSSLEEIIDRNFFQRVRQFKTEVGELIYLPEITAASIESNIVINNRFLTLVELESRENQESEEETQLLSDIFSDTHLDESGEIPRILDELQSHFRAEPTPSQVARFSQLLQIAIKSKEADTGSTIPAPEPILTEVEVPPPSALPFLSASEEALSEFKAQPENLPLIELFCQASAEVQSLDVKNFLSPLPEGNSSELKSETSLRRRVFELILYGDQVIRTELAKDCEPNDDIEERLEELFAEMERLSDDTRDLVKEARRLKQEANYEILLSVSNQMMGARLRLQSAIVRRTASELVEDQVSEIEIETRRAMQEISQETIAEKPSVKTSWWDNLPVNKWLLAGCILLILGALGIRMAMVSSDENLKDAADVAVFSPQQLPHGEAIKEAKIHRDLMVCVMTEQWAQISREDRVSRLQALMNFGKEKGVNIIMLLDDKGASVGMASREEIKVE